MSGHDHADYSPNPYVRLVKDGYAAFEARDWALAGSLIGQAAELAREAGRRRTLWFDAALAYKFARDWPKALELGELAVQGGVRGQEDPAFWNLGVAATALRRWDVARDAWAAYGVPIPPGEGEIREDLGWTCVRIETEGGQEVVWAVRLCPTRARVVSVPFHSSRRFGEVVLHDGVPNGERVVGGNAFPVFDEIMLFEPSDMATLSVLITAEDAADVAALADLFAAQDLGSEVPSTRRNLCQCCSEGSQTQERTFGAGTQQVLLGAPRDRAEALLTAWSSAEPGRRAWVNLHVFEG